MSESHPSPDLELAVTFANYACHSLECAVAAEKKLRQPEVLARDVIPDQVSTNGNETKKRVNGINGVGLKSQMMYSVAKRLVEQQIQHQTALEVAYRSNEIRDQLLDARSEADSLEKRLTFPWHNKRRREIELCKANEEVRRLSLLFDFSRERANFDSETDRT